MLDKLQLMFDELKPELERLCKKYGMEMAGRTISYSTVEGSISIPFLSTNQAQLQNQFKKWMAWTNPPADVFDRVWEIKKKHYKIIGYTDKQTKFNVITKCIETGKRVDFTDFFIKELFQQNP